ncbi:hypothetical protein BLA60_03960 [Actinophytocola xinjiangensis]|uniref:LemA protein n=1 Tax=Actinophytocola xinjiangensis TaxID=485602 RepID=A0A7Z0WS28_9PSEU|nr:hypothetical protein [Actinophytocola xinjiangensis]OLF14300.1 hypothetical protein BLA60_03960 [Actinophytocola xinjiangensis]
MNRTVVCAVLVGTVLAGCASPDAASPSPTSATSPPPSVSPMESWVSLVCVAELMHALDPTLLRPPATDADTLPEAKRRMRQWTAAVAEGATTMVAELDEIGPPPEGGALAKAFDEHRGRYADLADVAGTSGAFVDAVRSKADLDTAATLVQLPMLAATTGLDTNPVFSDLARENPLCGP